MFRLLSWNVNGIRSACDKGFIQWLESYRPDVLCVQELRAKSHQVPRDFAFLFDYAAFWNHADRPGYAGTGILSRQPPTRVTVGFGDGTGDAEGRVITAHYPGFVLVNAYVPNGNAGAHRLMFKLRFCRRLLEYCRLIALRKPLALCGDFNIAHTDLDVAAAARAGHSTGALPEERSWMDDLVASGFTDSLRHLYPDTKGLFSWWAATYKAKERNLGWRFDYIFLSHPLQGMTRDAFVLRDLQISDHVPVGVDLELE